MIRFQGLLSQGLVLVALVLGLLIKPARTADFTVEPDQEGVTVKLNGQLLTRYLVKSGAKPILWPLIGPTGQEMTRGYPMRDPGKWEKKDHIHHRSFWFTHGDVNGISFWHEQGGNGNIVHRELVRAQGGPQAVIVTRNDWLGPDGKKQCEDQRRLFFGADGDHRWIDFEVTVTASDGPVKFGDTKEGSFGLRVAGSMRVELEQGGRIVNSEGQTDGDAWGKRAAWVDYSGPVKDQTVGVTIMDHPSSFRFPSYWHVRTYGLFAANPFGLHDFQRSQQVDGAHTLQAGESFTLRYRVLLHRGDAKQANVAKLYESFAQNDFGKP